MHFQDAKATSAADLTTIKGGLLPVLHLPSSVKLTALSRGNESGRVETHTLVPCLVQERKATG